MPSIEVQGCQKIGRDGGMWQYSIITSAPVAYATIPDGHMDFSWNNVLIQIVPSPL